jgi:hypothetical protein
MEHTRIIEGLSHNAVIFRELMSGISEEQARWKPAPDRWSLLEVINHLHDIEREDFRTHLDIVLHHPKRPWPSINIMEWLTSRSYNERDIEQSLNRFLREREQSLSWLEGLSSPAWDTEYVDPASGKLRIRAGDLMVSWAAHDYFHIEQSAKLHGEYLTVAFSPYSTDYAVGA